MSIKIVRIRVGSTTIECEASLAYLAGFSAPYTDDPDNYARDEHRYCPGMSIGASTSLAIALSEGRTGEDAVLRAVALRTSGSPSGTAQAEERAAKLRASAAEAELRAEQIRSARQKRERI